MAFTLPVLVAGCGSTPVAESAGTRPPISQHSDDVVSTTVGALEAIGTAGDVDDVPDYSAAELEVLLDSATIDGDEGDTPEPEPLDAGSPAAAIEAIETELEESTGVAVGATPILDTVQPLDDAPAGAVFGIREGRHINEAGEAIRLDEAAALACANVEIALTALDEGRPLEAADHLRAASVTAADTSVSALRPWSSVLEETAADVVGSDMSTDTVSALLAFLSTCTQGGYEL